MLYTPEPDVGNAVVPVQVRCAWLQDPHGSPRGYARMQPSVHLANQSGQSLKLSRSHAAGTKPAPDQARPAPGIRATEYARSLPWQQI